MWWAYTRGGGLYSGGLVVGGLQYGTSQKSHLTGHNWY
jgi:hypothetical protein